MAHVRSLHLGVLSHVGDRHEVQEDHPKSEDTKQIETGNGHAAISMIISLQNLACLVEVVSKELLIQPIQNGGFLKLWRWLKPFVTFDVRTRSWWHLTLTFIEHNNHVSNLSYQMFWGFQSWLSDDFYCLHVLATIISRWLFVGITIIYIYCIYNNIYIYNSITQSDKPLAQHVGILLFPQVLT